MATRNLKELFLEPWSDKAPALFSSQREIARAISGQSTSQYSGKEKSLTVFVNQIITHNRPCPAPLAVELIATAKEIAGRRSSGPTPSEVEKELRAALLGGDDGKGLSVSDILNRQIIAKEVVIINPSTVESRGHPREAEFLHATVSALRDETGASYYFFLDETTTGRIRKQHDAILGELKNQLIGESDPAEAAQSKFQELKEKNRLWIYPIPSIHCIIPVVAFDPDGPNSYADLYVWDWSSTDGENVVDNIAKLSEVTKNKWLDDFYETYLRPKIKEKDTQP